MTASSGADTHRAIVDYADSGRAFAVVVMLRAEDPTPREAAAKAVIDSSGTIRGTVGGGPVPVM